MSVETILAILILILGILAFISSYLLFLAGKKYREPTWSAKSSSVIYNKKKIIEGLEMTYNGDMIDNITASQVLFWNNGNEIIRFQDISSSDPVRIKVDKTVKILNVKVLPSNLPPESFTVELNEDENVVLIKFDALERGQGAVMQILHTGLPSTEVRLLGSIRGVPSIYYIKNPLNLVPSALAEVSFTAP